MDKNKKFQCERCKELADEKGNIFWGYVLLLPVSGNSHFQDGKICKDCAGFLNFIAFSLLIFLAVMLLIVMVINFL